MSEETTQNLPSDVLRLILARLDSMDERLNNMDARLNGIDERLDSMDQRLEKLEARAYDTKPIWERALAEIIEFGKRMESLDRRFSVLTDDIIHIRADIRRVDDRIASLEQPTRT